MMLEGNGSQNLAKSQTPHLKWGLGQILTAQLLASELSAQYRGAVLSRYEWLYIPFTKGLSSSESDMFCLRYRCGMGAGIRGW